MCVEKKTLIRKKGNTTTWCAKQSSAEQQSLLVREVNAGNPVKPVGNFQLRRKEGVDAKKCVVTVARLQTSSIFMRDMYGRVNKKGWFKK